MKAKAFLLPAAFVDINIEKINWLIPIAQTSLRLRGLVQPVLSLSCFLAYLSAT